MLTQYIAQEYVSINMDSAEVYLQALEDYIEKDYDKQSEAFLLKLRALLAEYSFSYEESMELRRQSYALFRELEDYNEMGWTARGIGILHYQLGDYGNATEQFILSLSAFETDENKLGIAEIYNLLGAVNYSMGHLDKAQDYYNSSIELFNDIGKELSAAKVINNIGIILYDQEEYEQALEYYEKALKSFQETEYNKGISGVLGNMSLCYHDLGFHDKALEYIHRSRTIAVANEQIIDETSAYVNIGSFHREAGSMDSALYYLNLAYSLSSENKISPIEVEAHHELSLLFEKQGDFKKAYEHQLKYYELHLELHTQEAEIRVQQLMTSYEQKLKQQEIDILRSDQRMKSLLNKVFLALVIVSLGLLFIMVYGYTTNRKKNTLLEENNLALKEINQKLKESEEALKLVIEDKNKLFTIIAHDLRNPVAAVSGFSELLLDNYEQLDDHTRKEYLSQILQGSGRTYELLENMLLWARSQMDAIVIKKSEVEFDKLIKESLLSVQASIDRKEIELTVSSKCALGIYADYEMMKAVIRNLITNAVKFSYPGGKIDIHCTRENGLVLISVADQGIGIEQEKLQALFQQHDGPSTPGTSGESGSGLGLMICKDYTERNSGTISVNSKPGKGSTFTISLPESKQTT